MKKIKLNLIAPKRKIEGNQREFWDYKFLSIVRGVKTYSIPCLALPTVAALTPPDIEVKITDENIESINYDDHTDIVGITANTFVAERAYEIADEYKKRGVIVILGGVHVSMLPDEASRHADAVVIGEAENVWAGLIEDYKNSQLKQFYFSDKKPSLKKMPLPRYDLLNAKKYAMLILQTTRGCPFDCEFCSVKAFLGQKFRCKVVAGIIKEIKILLEIGDRRVLFFADDNLVGNKKHATELLEAIIPMKITYMGQVSINVAKDKKMLELLAKSGCKRVIIGIESLSENNLKQMGKQRTNSVKEYMKNINIIQSYGIEVYGSFIFGCDYDDESVFENTLKFINSANLSSVVLNILTPYPGTRLYQRLEKENRILHRQWRKYDHTHVCYKPKLMSPQALQNGYTWIRQQVYSYDNIFKRLRGLWELWNQTDARLWDRISPILVNLDANDVAYSYPQAIDPKQFCNSDKLGSSKK